MDATKYELDADIARRSLFDLDTLIERILSLRDHEKLSPSDRVFVANVLQYFRDLILKSGGQIRIEFEHPDK